MMTGATCAFSFMAAPPLSIPPSGWPAFLRAHLSTLPHPEAAAQALGVAYHTFRKQFAKVAGCTPGVFLRRARVEAACTLLRTTNCSCAEIALVVGFPRVDTAARAFRRERGETMRAYRRRVRGSPPQDTSTSGQKCQE